MSGRKIETVKDTSNETSPNLTVREPGSNIQSRKQSVLSSDDEQNKYRYNYDVKAPPGKLDIVLAKEGEAKQSETIVVGFNENSPFSGKISIGSKIVAVDGDNVSQMTVSEINAIISRKSQVDRILTVESTTKPNSDVENVRDISKQTSNGSDTQSEEGDINLPPPKSFNELEPCGQTCVSYQENYDKKEAVLKTLNAITGNIENSEELDDEINREDARNIQKYVEDSKDQSKHELYDRKNISAEVSTREDDLPAPSINSSISGTQEMPTVPCIQFFAGIQGLDLPEVEDVKVTDAVLVRTSSSEGSLLHLPKSKVKNIIIGLGTITICVCVVFVLSKNNDTCKKVKELVHITLAIEKYNEDPNGCSPYGKLQEWDLSQITDLSELFNENMNFTGINENINIWDVSAVTSMYRLFRKSNFSGDVSSWDVSKVDHMRMVFETVPFNSNLNAWDVSSCTTMRNMFYGNEVFNRPLDKWDVSSVLDMNGMFANSGVEAFNQDISMWDVSNVTKMRKMFRQNKSFDHNLTTWNVLKVIDIHQMFQHADSFTEKYTPIFNNPNVTF